MAHRKPKPLHDRILVLRSEEVEAPTNGIIIPDAAKEKPQQGTVIAIGNGMRDTNGIPQPMDVRVNDVILFGKYSGTEIKIDGEDLLIMREEEVLCIL